MNACKNCDFVVTRKEESREVLGHGGIKVTEKSVYACRRFPPQLSAIRADRWPRVEGDDWCGEYRANNWPQRGGFEV